MTFGIHDSEIRIGDGQLLATIPTSVVQGGAVGDEMRRLVDKQSNLGFGTEVNDVKEVIADVDESVVVGS